jgi:hypothetical protein
MAVGSQASVVVMKYIRKPPNLAFLTFLTISMFFFPFSADGQFFLARLKASKSSSKLLPHFSCRLAAAEPRWFEQKWQFPNRYL